MENIRVNTVEWLCSDWEVNDNYSLRPILLFVNMNVSTTKMCLDTSVLAKSNMGRREYIKLSPIAMSVSRVGPSC
jgi:hypothetical protein